MKEYKRPVLEFDNIQVLQLIGSDALSGGLDNESEWPGDWN